MTRTHPLATAWLEQVERFAADLPPGERSELLADLREHLDLALRDVSDDAGVAAVLRRLGDPADVVAAMRPDGAVGTGDRTAGAGDGADDVPAGLTAAEIVAIAVLVVAGLIGILVWPVSVLLWAIGIAIVAVSGRWRGGEVLGMILLPVVWALPVLSLVVPVGVTVESCTTDASGSESCTVESSGVVGPWALVAVLVGLVLIVLGTRWLARAPHGRPRRR